MTEKNTQIPAHGSNISRAEIPAYCKWQVQDIYSDENAWQKDCEKFQKLLSELKDMQGKITTAKTLYEALHLQDTLAQLIDKIYAYARLQQDADNTDQHMQALSGEAEGLAADFSNANSFIEPEMLALGKEKVEEMIASEPLLQEYAFYIANLLRLSDHVLSADKEAIFSQSHLATCSAANAFRALVSADMEFPPITDGAGKPAIDSEGNYILNMSSPDRELRKNSFQGLMGTYHKFRNTLATTLTGSARTALYFAKVHNYKDTLESCLAQDNIPTSLYDGLIQTVHDNFAPLHEYMQLKKDVLGYDELHPYDIYVPLSKAADSFACDFPEACAMVEAALKPLGEDYLATLHKGLTSGWIDVYENEGKRGGAYSSCGDPHPFVLLNQKDTLDSMFTIAHEMGHSLHTYYSIKNQPVCNADYVIFVAEVASTCNEVLLMRYLLNNTADKRERAYLINHFLESFRGTVYRQTMFAEFELFMSRLAESGTSLTADALCNKYYELNKFYFGDGIVIDKEIAEEWARIPHFFYNFYVFQYATGFSAACAIAERILTEGEKAVEDYKKFLSAGCSMDPISILKLAGVDMTTAQPVNDALKLFGELIDEMDALLA